MLSDYVIEQIQERLTESVRRGIRKLDAYFQHSNWRHQIDYSDLDMYCTTNCVLGQIFSNFDNGQRTLRIQDSEFFGFSADEIVDEIAIQDSYRSSYIGTIYNMLTATWEEEADTYEYEGMPA